MDRAGEWRLVDSDEPDDEAVESSAPAVEESAAGSTRWLVAAVVALVVGVAGGAIWLTLPQPDVRLDVGGRAFQIGSAGSAEPPAETDGPAANATPSTIVVDIEGAVARPGLHRIAAASRVGDAIQAAGGYSPAVDIRAAAAQLNLAALLDDGAKIHVPALGDGGLPSAPSVPGSPADGTSNSTGTGGLIDVNRASAQELETLPGIGEVTAAKIIAAREEMPFGSIEELLGRQVVGPATMDKIRALIAVTQ